jgi:hypothetical protein
LLRVRDLVDTCSFFLVGDSSWTAPARERRAA